MLLAHTGQRERSSSRALSAVPPRAEITHHSEHLQLGDETLSTISPPARCGAVHIISSFLHRGVLESRAWSRSFPTNSGSVLTFHFHMLVVLTRPCCLPCIHSSHSQPSATATDELGSALGMRGSLCMHVRCEGISGGKLSLLHIFVLQIPPWLAPDCPRKYCRVSVRRALFGQLQKNTKAQAYRSAPDKVSAVVSAS